jgi:hypothetical protein
MTTGAMLIAPFGDRITETIKALLEEKHLYQSVTMSIEELKEHLPKTWVNPAPSKVWAEFQRIAAAPWHPAAPQGSKIALVHAASAETATFNLPDVKLHCSNCDRTEAYNAVAAEDVIASSQLNIRARGKTKITVQQFVFSFQCQSCKAEPEVFLVRRVGLRLMLCGRSPIEQVLVPRTIPKSVKAYYSDALVSHNSGFTLAGIFFLRTLIEQFVYSLNPSCKDATEALDWYMQQLPRDFKERFKSFRELYELLSSGIHKAEGSSDLFESSIVAIDEHFEARRLFKLSERPV